MTISRWAVTATVCVIASVGHLPQNVRAATSRVHAGGSYRPKHAHVPACTHAGKAIALPNAFPHNFPVPSGTTFTGTRVPIGGGVAVKGFIPSSSFASSVHFFPREVKRAGFKVYLVEIDTPRDSEAQFRGHGYRGGWAVKALPGCLGAMSIQVSAIRLKK